MAALSASDKGMFTHPRVHASWSKDNLTIPPASRLLATVDLPEPAGPHMKTTLDMGVMLARDAGSSPAAAVDRRLCERSLQSRLGSLNVSGFFYEMAHGWSDKDAVHVWVCGPAWMDWMDVRAAEE